MRYLIVLSLLALAGCGTFSAGPAGIDADGAITDRETEYYRAQAAAQIARAQAMTAPIFELEAAAGETLQISGLARIAVRAPTPGGGMSIAQYENEWARVVGQVATAVLPLAVGQIGAYQIARQAGRVTTDVASAMGAQAGAGYAALGQAGQQTTDVATSALGTIGNVAESGFGSLNTASQQTADTAIAGLAATTVTADAGLAANVAIADAGFDAAAQFGAQLQALAGQGIDAASKPPVIVERPVIVPSEQPEAVP